MARAKKLLGPRNEPAPSSRNKKKRHVAPPPAPSPLHPEPAKPARRVLRSSSEGVPLFVAADEPGLMLQTPKQANGLPLKRLYEAVLVDDDERSVFDSVRTESLEHEIGMARVRLMRALKKEAESLKAQEKAKTIKKVAGIEALMDIRSIKRMPTQFGEGVEVLREFRDWGAEVQRCLSQLESLVRLYSQMLAAKRTDDTMAKFQEFIFKLRSGEDADVIEAPVEEDPTLAGGAS